MKNLPYTAETDIEGYRLVTFGTTDGEVKPTNAKTAPDIGAPEGTSDVGYVDNVGKVKLSGTVAAGDDLTAAADGKAAKATAPTYGASSTAGDRVFGMALQAGADGDEAETYVAGQFGQGGHCDRINHVIGMVYVFC